MRRLVAVLLLASPFTLAVACTASNQSEFSESDDAGGGNDAGDGGASSENGTGGFNLVGTGGSGGAGIPCTPTDDEDFDQDGWSINDGDCNDCDANVGPNAVEVPTDEGFVAQDEDCDGDVDEDDSELCDADIAIDESDPLMAVRATELCKMSSGDQDWGVVSAKWVLADGAPPPVGNETNFHLGHGVLDGFGPNVSVRKGERMLVLSSGSARQPNDPGYQDVGGFSKGYTSNHPYGFPKDSMACPGTTTGTPNDATGLEVEIRTPQNAHGLSFDFDFYTYEWPVFVCSTYNDFFVALLEPYPPAQTDGLISFDSQGNPVSVNNAFIEVCGCPENPPSPCQAGGKLFDCALGDTELIGTGFGLDTAFQDHGATSWLTSTAPVEPNSVIQLRWAVYDSGDGVLDSTTLIDNFRWIAETGVPVKTVPTPN